MQTEEGLPHGTILGVTKEGVIGYNCNYRNNPDSGQDGSYFVDGYYVGMKWQCVVSIPIIIFDTMADDMDHIRNSLVAIGYCKEMQFFLL